MLYSHTLSARQMQLFRSVLVALKSVDYDENGKSRRGGGETLGNEIRRNFRRYAKSQGAEDLAGPQPIWSILGPKAKEPVKHSEIVALFCDYLFSKFKDEIRVSRFSSRDIESDILKKIEHLRLSVSGKIRKSGNPFDYMAMEMDASEWKSEIPPKFLGSFVGYRRSAHDEDVVRFLFNIKEIRESGQSFVTYVNKYQRHGVKYLVNGGGIYSDGTLYMFGNARRRSGKSHSYRMQALSLLQPDLPILIGPVISRDRVNPFAARIVLIPLKDHRLTKRQRDMSHKELREDFVSSSLNLDKKEYINEIKNNVGYLFERKDNVFGVNGERGLFFYISNLTSTVVLGIPDFADKTILNEVRVREFLHRHPDMGASYSSNLEVMLSERVRNFREGTN